MIRNEVVTAFVNAVQVYPSNIQITAGIGKGYNTCTMGGTNVTGNVGESVTVTINGDTYTFIVTERAYGKNSSINLTCKGTPFTLENQSESTDELDYLDSDSLIESERGVVPVVNQLPNIDFAGQTYTKSSTAMSRILDMVRVVGGEAFEVNGDLYLTEIKSINEIPNITHTFADGEVIDFAYSDNIDKSIKLKQVLINPITDDIYSNPSITLEYDEDLFEANTYFNPSLSLALPYDFVGITPRPSTNGVKTETISVENSTYVNTIAGIDSIIFIKLNGEPITTYTPYVGYNTIQFPTAITGEIEISYTTKMVTSYVTQTTTFSIKYQCVAIEGTIDVDADSLTSADCSLEIISPLTYEDVGKVICYLDTDAHLIFIENKGDVNINTITDDFHIGGGILKVSYTYDSTVWTDTSFMQNITSVIIPKIETTSGEIFYDEDLLLYIVYLPYKIVSINDILSGNVGITGYTYIDSVVPYISFQATDVGKTVDISMNIDVVELSIPAPLAGHPVSALDAIGCSGITSTEYEASEDTLCSLPATFKVEIACEFDVSIYFAKGKVITWDGGADLIVDSFGKVEVTISSALLYTLNCDTIKLNGRIELDARGVV